MRFPYADRKLVEPSLFRAVAQRLNSGEKLMKNDLMMIGEIADFFGISRKAIRLYEKKGIIQPVKVDDANGYRYYSAAQVQQLNALLELKALGFSLDEIKRIIDGKAEKATLLEMLEKKRQASCKCRQIQRGMPGRDDQKSPGLPRSAEDYGNDRRRTGVAVGKDGMP